MSPAALVTLPSTPNPAGQPALPHLSRGAPQAARRRAPWGWRQWRWSLQTLAARRERRAVQARALEAVGQLLAMHPSTWPNMCVCCEPRQAIPRRRSPASGRRGRTGGAGGAAPARCDSQTRLRKEGVWWQFSQGLYCLNVNKVQATPQLTPAFRRGNEGRVPLALPDVTAERSGLNLSARRAAGRCLLVSLTAEQNGKRLFWGPYPKRLGLVSQPPTGGGGSPLSARACPVGQRGPRQCAQAAAARSSGCQPRSPPVHPKRLLIWCMC